MTPQDVDAIVNPRFLTECGLRKAGMAIGMVSKFASEHAVPWVYAMEGANFKLHAGRVVDQLNAAGCRFAGPKSYHKIMYDEIKGLAGADADDQLRAAGDIFNRLFQHSCEASHIVFVVGQVALRLLAGNLQHLLSIRGTVPSRLEPDLAWIVTFDVENGNIVTVSE